MLEIRYNLGWTLSSVEQQCICLIDETIFVRSNGIQLIMLCRRFVFSFNIKAAIGLMENCSHDIFVQF